VLLALDCSYQTASGALARGDGTLVASFTRPPGTWRGERLIDELAELLAGAGADWRELEALAVSIGPGRFTGVRTAVALARAVGLATGLPVYAVSTLETLAALAASDPATSPLLALLPGKKGEVYAQRFHPDGSPAEPATARSPADLAAVLRPPLRLVGPRAAWQAIPGADRVAHTDSGPHALGVLRAALRRRAAGGEPAPASSVSPLYLRAPDADPGAGRPLIASTA